MAQGGLVQKNRSIHIRINDQLKARLDRALAKAGVDQTDFITSRILEFVERYDDECQNDDKEEAIHG